MSLPPENIIGKKTTFFSNLNISREVDVCAENRFTNEYLQILYKLLRMVIRNGRVTKMN